jgi:hypothetical protein
MKKQFRRSFATTGIPGRRAAGYFAIGAILVSMTLLLSFGAPADVHPTAAPHSEEAVPRKLRSLMTGLSIEMQRIQAGLWLEDFLMIEEGARAIAQHPRITPEEIQAIRQALGDEFEAFVQFDVRVHDEALEVAKAAEGKNLALILRHYSRIQQGCLACHAGYRVRVQKALYR